MANTTNYNWTLPTVGGSENEWGGDLNANWTALDTLLGGVTNTEFQILNGATVSTAELNILDGATVTTTELNYVSGATSNLQTQINDIVAAAGGIVSGMILMWSGSTSNIPSGWFLCNGSNGTPDLRDRFIVGAGSSYAVGATGGADSVTLTSDQIPSHSHTFSGTTNTTGAHTHSISEIAPDTTGGTSPAFVNVDNTGDAGISTDSAGSHSHSFSGTTSSTGGGSSHENRPPYYALAYIMKA